MSKEAEEPGLNVNRQGILHTKCTRCNRPRLVKPHCVSKTCPWCEACAANTRT